MKKTTSFPEPLIHSRDIFVTSKFASMCIAACLVYERRKSSRHSSSTHRQRMKKGWKKVCLGPNLPYIPIFPSNLLDTSPHWHIRYALWKRRTVCRYAVNFSNSIIVFRQPPFFICVQQTKRHQKAEYRHINVLPLRENNSNASYDHLWFIFHQCPVLLSCAENFFGCPDAYHRAQIYKKR